MNNNALRLPLVSISRRLGQVPVRRRAVFVCLLFAVTAVALASMLVAYARIDAPSEAHFDTRSENDLVQQEPQPPKKAVILDGGTSQARDYTERRVGVVSQRDNTLRLDNPRLTGDGEDMTPVDHQALFEKDDGYDLHFHEGGYSDIEVYGIDTVVEMAKSGDRKALLEASMIASLPFEQRKTMAIAAAQLGYTAALTKLGASKLMEAGRIPLPPQLDSRLALDPEDAVWGFALVKAALDLGDSGAIELLRYDPVFVSPAERRLAGPRAEAIVETVTSHLSFDLLEAIDQ